MIKFVTSNYGIEIREQEVTRETEKCYFIPNPYNLRNPEDRRLKDQNYHETWEAAHTHLLNRSTRAVESAQSQLDWAKNQLAKVQDMKR